MAVEIVMPRVDMDMATGRMGRWHVAEGGHVEKGETLFEIETDKAAMEVDAPASGVLKFVAASEGDVLPVGTRIGWIVAEGEAFAPPAGSKRDDVDLTRDDGPAPQPVLNNGRSSERPVDAPSPSGKRDRRRRRRAPSPSGRGSG